MLQAGGLTGSELYEALVARLQKNQRLHCCIDACQSGFSLDLPHRGYIRADAWAGWEVGGLFAAFTDDINLSGRRLCVILQLALCCNSRMILVKTMPQQDAVQILAMLVKDGIHV